MLGGKDNRTDERGKAGRTMLSADEPIIGHVYYYSHPSLAFTVVCTPVTLSTAYLIVSSIQDKSYQKWWKDSPKKTN